MSRRKFISIYVISLLIISIAVIGLGSWLIIPTSSAAATHPTVNPEDVDTSPCFESETYFTGKYQEPSINDIGKEIYGTDFEDTSDPSKNKYTVEWQCGKYADGTTIPDNVKDTYKGIVAGTHYYKITDKTTGQVISHYHELVINQDEFTTATTNTPGTFEGNNSLEWTVTLQSKYSGLTFQFKHTRKGDVGIYEYDQDMGFLVELAAEPVLGNTSLVDKTSYNNFQLAVIDTANYKGVNLNNFKYSSVNLNYDLSYNILPTSYNQNGSTVTYYGTLMKAINGSGAGTIYAMQQVSYNDENHYSGTSYNHAITETCTIGSGITLTIPYDSSNTLLNKTRAYTNGNTFGKAGYLTNNVVIADGCQVTNNGTINIAAEVTGGNGGASTNSIVAGKYAQITMSSGSKITNTSNIVCYGFITEAAGVSYESHDDANAPKVEMNGGDITVVFSVIEHRGGTAFSNMLVYEGWDIFNSKPVCTPFNRFFIQSVCTNLIVSSSATVTGYANLYASSKDNETSIKLVGTSSSHLLQISSGSKLVSKYVKDESKLHLDVYGNAAINSLSITVSTIATLSTEHVFLPISHYWNINLYPLTANGTATVSTVQDLKLLPGSSVTVHAGVTLNIDDLAVYGSTSEHAAALQPNEKAVAAIIYEDKEAAIFNLDGTLNVGNFGGKITALGEAGTVNIKTGNTISSKETTDLSSGQGGTTASVTLTAKGDIVSNGTVQTNGTFATLKKYFSSSYDSKFVWCDPTIIINFDGNGATVNGNDVYSASTTTTYNGLEDSNFLEGVTPDSRPGYAFLGWFTEKAPDNTEVDETKRADPSTMRFGTTVYAWWKEAATVDVNYTATAPSGATGTYTEVSNSTSGTPLDGSFTAWAEISNTTNYSYSKYIVSWKATWSITFEDGTTQEIDGATYNVGSKVDVASALTGIDTDSIETCVCTMVANWSNKHTITLSTSNATITVTYNGHNYTTNGYVPNEAKLSASVSYSETDSRTFTYTVGSGSAQNYSGAEITVEANIKFTASSKSGGCFTGDTLVTLGDGTKKPVEDLTYEDMLLVWDFYSGEYAVMPIAAIINHGENVCDSITLWFEDNTKIELLSSHELFCADLNRWVCINKETVSDYVGMSFVKACDDGYYTVKMTDYEIETKSIEAYSVLTAVHYNCIAGDLFTLIPSMFGSTNYYVPFEIGENLKYDEEAMQADIEKYGLFVYEDFADHVTYEQFMGFNAAYLKVSVGKGLVTYEQLIESIYAYVNPSAEEETTQNTE